jgi:serine/threonine protein kinase
MIHSRPVTVKLAQPGDNVEGARRVLRREATHLRSITHPAYQRLLGGNLDAAEPFLVLEYVEGPTLHTILEAEGPFADADALNVATELVSALGFLHRVGFGHMDVNPANVILRDGRVVVMDLGLVFPLGEPIPAGSPRGTQGFIAPEQWDSAPCAAGMDVFSVGCVLYELLTGEQPFDFDDRPTVPLPSLTRPRFRRNRRRQLDEVLARLTAMNPLDRLRDSEQAMLALASVRTPSERLWPTYVDNLLRNPPAAQPGWSELVR